jgi:hypothetical protein
MTDTTVEYKKSVIAEIGLLMAHQVVRGQWPGGILRQRTR